MVAHNEKLLEELLKQRITPLLKTNGFKKAGMSYEKENADAVIVVQFQRSRDHLQCDRFTVNLGVSSKRILAFEGKAASRIPVDSSHWRMRLGRTLDEPTNAWWDLCEPADVDAVGSDVEAILTTKALPLLEAMASDDALTAGWKTGRAPGLTDLQRLLNLTVLLNDVDHRAEQRIFVDELKDLASRKGFGGRVAVHLEDLGIE